MPYPNAGSRRPSVVTVAQGGGKRGGANDQAHYQRVPFSLPFVGREKELHDILAFVQQTTTGDRLHILWLAGEAGIGKSRLLGAVAQEMRDSCVVRATFYPDSASSPLIVLAAALAALPEAVRLFGQEPQPSVASITSALRRLARLRPTMLILEDVHLLSIGEAQELADLIELLEHEPLPVVCATRPGTWPLFRLLRGRVIKKLSLGPFAVEDLHALFASSVNNSVDQLSVEMLHVATRGVPLVVRAALMEWIEGSQDGPDSGFWENSPFLTVSTRADLAVEALVAGLTRRLDVNARETMLRLAALGEIFAPEAAALVFPEFETIVGPLLDEGILVEPLVVLPPLTGHADESRPLCFVHTLLHAHLLEQEIPANGELLALIESDLPLYSIVPFQRLAEAALTSQEAERGIRRMVEVVNVLIDTQHHEAAIAIRGGALRLYQRYAASLPELLRDDLHLSLERLQLRLLASGSKTDEIESTLHAYLHRTSQIDAPSIAVHHIAGIDYALHRGIEIDTPSVRRPMENIDRLLTRWPELRLKREYISLLGTLAAGTRLHTTGESYLDLRARFNDVLVAAAEQNDDTARREALTRVAPFFLSQFRTEEDLADRRELADAIHNEYEGDETSPLSIAWPRFLESTGEAKRTRSLIRRFGLYPLPGRDPNVELSLRVLDLAAEAALGAPLETLRNHALDLLDEFATLLGTSYRAKTKVIAEFTVGAQLLRIAVLRGALDWGRTVTAPLDETGRLQEAYLFEEGVFRNDLAIVVKGLRGGRIDGTFAPIAAHLLGSRKLEPARLRESLAYLLESPVLRVDDLIRLRTTIGLVAIALSEEGQQEIHHRVAAAIERGLEWCAKRDLPGLMEPFLVEGKRWLPDGSLGSWKRKIQKLHRAAQAAGEPGNGEKSRPSRDQHQVEVQMLGEITIRRLDRSAVHRLSGTRARAVLGLLAVNEIRRPQLTLDEFRSLSTGMERQKEAGSYLRIMISRLRGLIGKDAIISDGSSAPKLNRNVVRIDLVEAHNRLSEAIDAAHDEQTRQAAEALDAGLRIIAGRTAWPSLYEEHFDEARAEFEARLRRATLLVVALLRQERDREQAARLLRSACEALPYDDEIVEMLVEELKALGRHVEALQVARRAQELDTM